MSYGCNFCNKRFNASESLQQHLNSPAHARRFACTKCDRAFRSDEALQQHLNSPTHAPRFECAECDRAFGSEQALQQHLSSPAHAPSFECEECDRTFGSREALQQHLNSPAHAPNFECAECDRTFGSDEALQQHLNSPAHAPSFECGECDQIFRSDEALEQHQRSPLHTSDSPLDQFFLSFPDFDYDSSATPSEEFLRLRRLYGWDRGDVDGTDAWSRYMDALVLEFNLWYGTDSQNLQSWQDLCRILQVYPLPQTCKACCKSVRACFVNLVDLIDFSRGTPEEVQIFADLQSLRAYTVRTGRIFPKDSLQAGALLRNLLREIFVR